MDDILLGGGVTEQSKHKFDDISREDLSNSRFIKKFEFETINKKEDMEYEDNASRN